MKKKFIFKNYASERRFISYYYQIKYILKLDISSLLVIGIGDGLVIQAIKSYFNKEGRKIKIKTFDIDKELKSDYLGDVRNISKHLKKNSFDCILICEVLEHIEYDELRQTLRQLRNITKKCMVLSVPKVGATFRGFIKLPILKEFEFCFKFPYFKKLPINDEHKWELNRAGHSVRKFIKLIEEVPFKILKKKLIIKEGSHLFLILKK